VDNVPLGSVIVLCTTPMAFGSIADTYAGIPTITSGTLDLSNSPQCCDYVCLCMECSCCLGTDTCYSVGKRCGPFGLCLCGTMAVIGSAMVFLGSGVVKCFGCVCSGCCEIVQCFQELQC